MSTESIKQITVNDLEEAIGELRESSRKSSQIAVFYLEKELRRRKNSGRPVSSELSRKEQINEAVKRHRAKQTHIYKLESD